MLEVFIIGLVGFLILLFFHRQSSHEFKINQLTWAEKSKIETVLMERVPLVLKGLSPVAFWTQQDVMMRTCYAQAPIFKDKGLSDWLSTTDINTACPWSQDHAGLLGRFAGLDIWTEKALNELIQGSIPGLSHLAGLWYRPNVSCWAGSRGLWQTRSRWTCLFVTEGAVQVSILPGTCIKALPPTWKQGTVHPSTLTVYDTPFVADLKFMDIVLRPGHLLIMPNHWCISWLRLDSVEICPMVAMVEYHTPISLLGF